MPEISADKLITLSDTRWVEKHYAIERFCVFFEPIIEALREISKIKQPDNSALANALLSSVDKSEFLTSVIILRRIFGISLSASIKLQGKTMNIVRGFELIELMISVLQEMRNAPENDFHQIYENSEKLALILGVEIQMPRISIGRTQ